MPDDNNIINQLIYLSKIFKEGYTIQIQDNNIIPYDNKHYGYVVSYKTIATIDFNKTETNIKYFKIKNLDKKLRFCFIGGWLDKENNIYYIEFNRIFSNKKHAMKTAKRYKQRYIYNLNKRELLKVV